MSKDTKTKLWAIVDIRKKEPRICYAFSTKLNGLIAIYDKKPKIKKEWKQFKKIVRVDVVFDGHTVNKKRKRKPFNPDHEPYDNVHARALRKLHKMV